MIWPFEAFALQTFLPQTEPGTLPVKDFDLVALFVDEHEQLSGKRIMRQLILDQDRQAVYALAKIHRATGEADDIEIVGWTHHLKTHRGRKELAQRCNIKIAWGFDADAIGQLNAGLAGNFLRHRHGRLQANPIE